MKAIVIKFYDEQGQEIKNVSTEIVLNGELYVKKEVDKQPDYSHLVGMWVKSLPPDIKAHKTGKYYQVHSFGQEHGGFIRVIGEDGDFDYKWTNPHKCFDLANPLPYNPDTVVGLKELPNDGKTYAECLEDVVWSNRLQAIKGLFYPMSNKDSLEKCENKESLIGFPLKGQTNFTSRFRIHTPAKPMTAVEWLLEQIENKNGKEFASYYSEFIDQAKAMEQEQKVTLTPEYEPKLYSELGMKSRLDLIGNIHDNPELIEK